MCWINHICLPPLPLKSLHVLEDDASSFRFTADRVSFRELARSVDEDDEDGASENSDASSGVVSDTGVQAMMYLRAQGVPRRPFRPADEPTPDTIATQVREHGSAPLLFYLYKGQGQTDVAERTESLYLNDFMAPSDHPTEEVRMKAQAPEDTLEGPQRHFGYDEAETVGLLEGETFDRARDIEEPHTGGELLGWPSSLPVPIQSISRTPTPPLADDGHRTYFRRKAPPVKVPSDPKPRPKLNPAVLIQQKQEEYALQFPLMPSGDVPSARVLPDTMYPPSRPKRRHRRKSHTQHGNSKLRNEIRGDAFEDPITIDISAAHASTSRAVQSVSIEHSNIKPSQAPRATLKPGRDHIKNVHPTLKFPNHDFIDRRGLTAAHGPAYPVNPAGNPWPNSIVSHTTMSFHINLPHLLYLVSRCGTLA
jgi:hypothetical protein